MIVRPARRHFPPLGAMPMRRLTVREEACIGCHLCEVWCVLAHSNSGNLIDCHKAPNKPSPRVKVHERKPLTFPLQCRQCLDPICVHSCPSGAMARGPDGVVRVDTERCQACWTCILVCPFGAVTKGDGFAVKCDLCPDREIPACVEHCPNEAVQVEEMDG